MPEQQSRIQILLQHAREGDVAAREELFECCRNYIAVLARTHVESWMRKKVDASDLVQQTLLEAHQGFQNFKGQAEEEWLAWLRQILAHNTHDFVRRFRTAKRAAGKELELDRPGTTGGRGIDLSDALPTPSQVAIRHEQQIELADALMKLSPDHQEVIHLRNLQRLPFDEIAERMGRTRPAAQMLWMRALKKLEELLHNEESAP